MSHGVPLPRVQLAMAVEILRVLYSLVYSYPAIPRRILFDKKGQDWYLAMNQTALRTAIAKLLMESEVFQAHCPDSGNGVDPLTFFDDIVQPELFNQRFRLGLRKDKTPTGVIDFFEQLTLLIGAIGTWDTRASDADITHVELISRYTAMGLLPTNGVGSRCNITAKSVEERSKNDAVHAFVTEQVFRFLQPWYAAHMRYFGLEGHLLRTR